MSNALQCLGLVNYKLNEPCLVTPALKDGALHEEQEHIGTRLIPF